MSRFWLLASVVASVLTSGLPARARAELRAFFPERVLFPTGSSRLRKEFVPVVEAVARRIRTGPAARRILLEGHTDTSGSEFRNSELGLRRSLALKEMLVRMGVEPRRLIARAFAARWPAATNRTEEGREQNRRVEFVVAPADFQPSAAHPTGADEGPLGSLEVPIHAATLRATGTTVHNQQGEPAALQEQDAVHAGERVETSRSGRAALRFPGVAVVRLGPATVLRVRALTASGALGLGGSELSLERGTLSIRLHYPRAKGGAQVHVSTAHGRLTLDYPAEARLVRRDDEVRLEVLRGKASWRGPDAALELPAGEAMLTTGAGAPKVVRLPKAPQPLAPQTGKISKAVFSWKAVKGATSYLLEVARDPSFLDVKVRKRVGETTAGAELEAGEWFWRVRSRNAEHFTSRPSTLHGFELTP